MEAPGTSEEQKPPAAGVDGVRPLVVDLDGTLVATNLLGECVCSYAAKKPLMLWLLPFWLLQGRAALKEKLAQAVSPDVSLLPYREDVLEVIRARKRAGGRIILATATDVSIARRIAEHLGVFDDVLASDGRRNCKGRAKLEAIRERIGTREFDYMGDSDADLPLVEAARRVWLVRPSAALRKAAEGGGKLEGLLGGASHAARSLLRLLRPHQWAKNLLIFVPVIAAHRLQDRAVLLLGALAFASFSLAASAVYILNDLCDLDSDRAHERKRRRPLASGEIPLAAAAMLAILLLASSFGIAGPGVSWRFMAVLGGYVLLTTAYSFWIKRKVFVDVLLLAGLYSYRLFAGGAATGIPLSDWLIVFSMFFFLSLALAKRYCELDQTPPTDGPNRRRGYRTEDLALLRILGPVAGYVSVMVLALYIASEATLIYPQRRVLWLVCPLLLYWISRVWFLAHRREIHDDPVVFALKDWRSLVSGLIAGAIVAVASMR